MSLPISLQDVRAAADRLAGVAHRTPVLTSRLANERSGAEVFFKCENLQRMGAFKFRGALQRARAVHARAAQGRRDRVLVGQPCAGHRAVGAAARHARR